MHTHARTHTRTGGTRGVAVYLRTAGSPGIPHGKHHHSPPRTTSRTFVDWLAMLSYTRTTSHTATRPPSNPTTQSRRRPATEPPTHPAIPSSPSAIQPPSHTATQKLKHTLTYTRMNELLSTDAAALFRAVWPHLLLHFCVYLNMYADFGLPI